MKFLTPLVNKLGSQQFPVVILRNDSAIEGKEERRVRTIDIGWTLVRKDNGLFDPWNVFGYEIHSGTIPIIEHKGTIRRSQTSAMGYVCHETGMTLDLMKVIESGSEGQDVFTGIEIPMTYLEAANYEMTAEKVPVVFFSADGIEYGKTIRRKGEALTDGPGQPVYRILPDTLIEIRNMNVNPAMGYVIDKEKRITVPILVTIKVEKGPTDPKKKPLVTPASEIKVFIRGKFEGILGKIIAFDKSEALGVGTSKRDFWIGIFLGALGMFLLRLII